ncbi:hypothetical protein A0H81_00077 [Grifola frondosa]|uniref:Amidase domain-containing protein n=1 Tax=Grifola frondosa TaxID=5627 RepID=A0A1C7MRG9_GRIFR|nr:hypothetical protein A0H81_00077 [Grifola frondosa]
MLNTYLREVIHFTPHKPLSWGLKSFFANDHCAYATAALLAFEHMVTVDREVQSIWLHKTTERNNDKGLELSRSQTSIDSPAMSAIPIPEIASGNPSYLAKATALKARLNAQIPADLRLPPSVLDNLPLDVTGIPASCGLLSAAELAITELDATAICQKIAAGELTAVETVTAFGKRAAIAHQLVSCLTDFFLDEGIARAKELDEYFKREGKVIGPLHGLPISIKDHMPIKGRWASGGFLASVEVSAEDCDMTSILRSLGTVFYVKTNQPQSIMHLETHSVYGRTGHLEVRPPSSPSKDPALVSEATAEDPSATLAPTVGIYGMKPTENILPTQGYLFYEDGQDGFPAATGPMCRSARDIQLFIGAIISAAPAARYPALYPFPWTVPAATTLWGGAKKLRSA